MIDRFVYGQLCFLVNSPFQLSLCLVSGKALAAGFALRKQQFLLPVASGMPLRFAGGAGFRNYEQFTPTEN